MTFSIMDEQDARRFAKDHPDIVAEVIGPEAEQLHSEDNLFGEAFTIAMFVAFCKSLAELLGGAVAITKIIDAAKKLFKWIGPLLSGNGSANNEELTLNERILVMTFEAFINRKAGVKPKSLSSLLEVDEKKVSIALEGLQDKNIVRKARDGSWKYVRPI
jgi:hypothetical protein